MRKHNRILATVLLVSMLIALIPVSGSAVTQCYTNLKIKSSTYLYSQASTGSTKIIALKSGTIVLCGAYTSTWCLVKYNGKIGYVPRSCCAPAASAATAKPTAAPTSAPAATPTPTSSLSSETAVPGNNNVEETAAPTPTSTLTPAVSATNPNGVKAGMKVVAAAAVSLYKSPSTSASKYGIITKGKVFNLIKTAGNLWGYVKVNDITGYCLLADLKQYTGSKSTGSASTPETVSVSMICYVKTAVTLYSSLTSGYVANLKVGDKVLVTKVKGTYAYLTTTAGKKGYTLLANLSKTRVTPQYTVVLSDWWSGDIQKVFPVGTNCKVIDVGTRKAFFVHRKGGTNHADVEPLTAGDTATIYSIYGEISWDRRAIWVVIGNKYYAASMNFYNHGEQTISNNNFNGHFCIHFYNSRTRGTDKVDAAHQAAVKAAYTTKP